ncbi:MAG: C69 family dipeptidase [Bacteroidales bacterium]|nr:C69 family dipeptidase [Bacteroidales bacterium]
MKKFLIPLFTALVLLSIEANACTNFLITKGASTDGSTMITYAADSHLLYGELYFIPAQDHAKGAMRQIVEWDTGKILGEIPQPSHTYSVVGNVNEHQVAIGETTYGGRSELVDTTGLIDYGSLIYITLERAKNAREAMKIMTELVEEYGYYSSGESFSIADPNEVWILELIGKGPNNKGAVWVARMVPDGYVCAHANQARITTFDYQKKNKWFDKNQTTFNSQDVISFAREKGYFNGNDSDFSFSDTYAPVDFSGARFCEIRVWAFFNAVTDGMDEYWEYAKGQIKHGENGYATNRMPLWVKPKQKVNVLEVMDFMRDHLEGTELDMSKDIGAGPYGLPYRWRPLTWEVDGITYCNERATATQQTAFSFVAQLRSWLPDKVGGINWFGVDDAGTTVYVPMYCGINKVPKSYEAGNGSIMDFTMNSAFWVFNLVSNLAYTRYELMYPEIRELQRELENKFVEEIKLVDAKILNSIENGEENTITNQITKYTNVTAENAVERWKQLWVHLFVKYLDGNIKEPSEAKEGHKYVNPKIEFPGYGEDWYRRIIEDTGDQFKMEGGGH